jgi:hypothetical protein
MNTEKKSQNHKLEIDFTVRKQAASEKGEQCSIESHLS